MKTQVAVVKNGEAYDLVKRALGLINVRARVGPQSKVFIKPNLPRVPPTSPYINEQGAYESTLAPEGDIVHREVIEALLRFLGEIGVKDVTIGEAAGGSETPIVYKSLGLYELADKYGAELVDLNYADSQKIEIPDSLVLKHIWVPKVLLESDFLINLPTLKVHGFTGVTLSLKNWGIGILPGKYYGINKTGRYKKGIEGPLPIHQYGTRKAEQGQEISSSQVIVDVCSAIKTHLNVVDGLTAVHYAPGARQFLSKTLVERTNMIIAGYDMVATDSVCSRILGFKPDKILHIKWAAERGIGVCDLSEIEVLGERVEHIEMRCNPLEQQVKFIRVD